MSTKNLIDNLSNTTNGVYWTDDIGPFPSTQTSILPEAEIVVIGSGYTGMHAAIITASAGKMTQVLDAKTPGWGCSTRNGGQISGSLKPSLESLSKRFGVDQARAIRAEGEASLDWVEYFVKKNKLDCDFARNGRFHAAHSPQHFEKLVAYAKKLSQEEDIPIKIVTRDDQRQEIGSDAYFGGVVFKHHASLHPAKYYSGILRTAIDAGAHVTGHCAAHLIEKTGSGFVVSTQKGKIKAAKVVIATNGYTSNLLPFVQRRVIPIGSYIIATEKLPENVMNRLMPTSRVISDTCKVVYYYRPSPDRSRILFGGRVSASETSPINSAPKLHHDLCRIFPELNDIKLSHSWSGSVAYTFDELMHIGNHNGIYYAMGYCGSGVGMASYLGMRLGHKVLGLAAGKTALDNISFPTRPFYRGKPWFLPAIVSWYRLQDRWQCKQAKKNSENPAAGKFAEDTSQNLR